MAGAIADEPREAVLLEAIQLRRAVHLQAPEAVSQRIVREGAWHPEDRGIVPGLRREHASRRNGDPSFPVGQGDGLGRVEKKPRREMAFLDALTPLNPWKNAVSGSFEELLQVGDGRSVSLVHHGFKPAIRCGEGCVSALYEENQASESPRDRNLEALRMLSCRPVVAQEEPRAFLGDGDGDGGSFPPDEASWAPR